MGYRDFQSNLRFQQTLALSPDGRQVAYVDDASGQFNLKVQPVSGGPARQLTSHVDRAVRRAAWHPDGRSLLFVADAKGDEKTQLYLFDLATEGIEAVSEIPGVQHVAAMGAPFSPDGRLLAYAANDRTPADQDILIRDLASGDVCRVPADGRRLYAGHWSPDGTRLSLLDLRTNHDTAVYVVAADGGSLTRVTPDDDASKYEIGPWLADGSGMVVLSTTGREFTGLGVLAADTGDVSWLDTPEWEVEEAVLSADGRVLVWNVNADGSAQLRARDLGKGEDLPMPDLPMGAVTELTISADGRRVALRMSTPTRPWNIATIDVAGGGELRWLTEAAPTVADSRSFVEPELVRYPAGDGHSVPAYLYRPRTGQGRAGVLLSIHGGPEWQERPVYTQDGFYQYLLSHGIGVLAPNVRGSTGYGKAYQKLIYRDWGGVDLRDFADAVAYLRSLDWVDPRRIGVYGGSYGGFSALSCVSRLPELDWAAGVSVCGPSNLVTLAKSSPPTWHSLVLAMFGDPDGNADHLLSRSPVTHADQIRAPLMVVQGANDPRVPQSESDQIVQRLRARGVEVRYLVFPDEGHGFTKRENQAKAYTDLSDFLVEHLAG
jgi:dipeptidyl aminopeptidase/acylaminoacyl peptidase